MSRDLQTSILEVSAALSSFAMANDMAPYKMIGHDKIKKMWCVMCVCVLRVRWCDHLPPPQPPPAQERQLGTG